MRAKFIRVFRWRHFLPGVVLVIGAKFGAVALGADVVVHWINGAGQNAAPIINGGGTFITDFKGLNDLQVTKLSGPANATDTFTDNYATNPGNNPNWIVNFVGSTVHGTGDGTAGHWTLLETAQNTTTSLSSIQLDFSLPLVSGDRMLIADVDVSEQHEIEAFVKVSNVYNPVSVAGWTHQRFTGEMGVLPDSRWATWDPVGLLTASTSSNINEPLTVLTIDQQIDRIVISKLMGGGSAGIQFASSNSVAGDYNVNTVVDAADYVIWRKLGGTQTQYNTWRANFGKTLASGVGVSANAAVPEPATFLLLMFAVAAWYLLRDRAA